MKVNMSKEIKSGTLLSHIILNTMSDALVKQCEDQIAEMGEVKNDIVLDVKMTAEGVDIDIQKFVDYWQSQVGRMIQEEAQNIVENRMNDIVSMMSDLEERVSDAVKENLYDWEKEQEKR